MIKAVFMDVDGTLTDIASHSIPDSALEAIHMAQKNGVKVCVASGRHTLMPQENGVIRDIGFDGCIGINGQVCHMIGEKPFYVEPLDRGDVELTLARCRKKGYPSLVVGVDFIAVTEVTDRVREFHDLVNIEVPRPMPEEQLLSRDILSMMPYVRPEEEASVFAGIKNSTTARWSPLATDLIPKTAGKDVGIARFLQHFGIDRSECMALGDGDNDTSMIRFAGVGVAMRTGRPEPIAAADFVAPAPIEGGMYYTFKYFNII